MRLTGYVVVELKTGKFQPEYAGKLNFYVALIDDMLRREHHDETIGILICGTKNDRSVRYSLGRSTSPMAVAAYTYDKLPADEKLALPNEGHLVAALERADQTLERLPRVGIRATGSASAQLSRELWTKLSRAPHRSLDQQRERR